MSKCEKFRNLKIFRFPGVVRTKANFEKNWSEEKQVLLFKLDSSLSNYSSINGIGSPFSWVSWVLSSISSQLIYSGTY